MASITFESGVGTVTGANFLFDTGTKKYLIDCGLIQGMSYADAANREAFSYDPAAIDALFVTHAHMDHIGRIGKLVKDGFRGTIYSTPATRDIAKPMLDDALRLLQDEARRDGVLPLYEEHHVTEAFNLWKTIEYYTDFTLEDGVSVHLLDSGHILGSAMMKFTRGDKNIIFTGDLGNSPSLFLRDTDSIKGAQYVVMESVYGDRNHESHEDRKMKLVDAIKDTIARKRTLIIPAFSLERTQDILFEINDLFERGEIEGLKVFIDSPLATKITEIYKKYSNDFNEVARDMIAQGDDLFNFPKLKFTVQRHESQHIHNTANPKVIIAGSGMSNGGRIVSHEKYYLPDPDTTLLLVGYQSVGTLGRQIADGAKKVTIEDEDVPVKAEVKTIYGYSSHKDSDHLIEFVNDAADSLKKVFVVMGEPKSALFLVQRLRDYVGVDATYPKQRENVEIEF